MLPFALTIFIGAFLLFLVQPLIGKFILPWYGGSPAVWTVCLLFFQVVLLMGYAYAHGVARWLKPRSQAILHVILLLTALAALPITPASHWKPTAGGDPTWSILALILACVGLPYFVLSATSPLLQAWFSRLHPGNSPYRLYALSNAGSLLALGSFPFVFEPAFSRQTLAALWGVGLGGFIICCGFCALRLWRANPRTTAEQDIVVNGNAAPPPIATTLLWFGLSACASVLLLATTNKICQDVAVVPFLWILPLSLYLTTFILCFASPRWYPRKAYHIRLVLALGLVCCGLFVGRNLPLWVQVGIYSFGLFAGGMVCNGELYRLKPATRFLTSYYLVIAGGGAAGGVFVAILAPLLFRSYWELHWALWMLPVLLMCIHYREKTSFSFGSRQWRAWPCIAGGVLGLGLILHVQAWRDGLKAVRMTRNFYGTLRVFEESKLDPEKHAFRLQSGGINHGMQFVEPSKALRPISYFHENSGIGLAFRNLPRQTNRCIGVLGLGAGTLAAYGREGDRIRFYELDPAMIEVAQGRFTYLTNSKARIEIVPGDGRLSLEAEPSQQFDLLVLDAFSGDAVPVHLLTREAFAVYRRHVKLDGVIAVHITNRHLDLLPVARGLAAGLGWGNVVISWSDPLRPSWLSPSTWVLVSNNREFLQAESIRHAATVPLPDAQPSLLLWTDDYASLFGIMKWHGGKAK